MEKHYNPYRGSDGRFRSGPKKRRIQYANSDERDDASEVENDIMNSNENLKDSQIQKSADEAKRLAEEKAQEERDREIAHLRAEIENFKEQAARARDTDTRQTYEKYARNYEKRLKKLLGG